MTRVGVRALKDSLSRYLKRVREGETIVVTDRGEDIARIIPVAIPPGLARMMAEGKATWSGRKFAPPKKVVRPRPGPPLSDYISEDRR